MTFRECLEGCLKQPIYLAKCSDVLNDAGDLCYEDPVLIDAYVELNTNFTENTEGTERTTRHTVITLCAVGDHDRLWLPGEDPEVCAPRMPAQVARCFDPDVGEISHWEVTL